MRATICFIFITISFLVIRTESVYRVRKYIQRPVVRSVIDDDLDMAAAELVFKEKQALKPMGDTVEGQKLPFGTEHTDKVVDSIGAPSVEPSFSNLRKAHLEDVEENETPLKSSMVGEGSITDDEQFLTTESPIHDGPTSRVSEQPRKWQQPLPNHGRLIAYDFNVNPEHPQFAPRARGLVGIPDGWNLDKTVDEEFRSGFRHVDFRRH